jgi:hypothetical protein
VLEGLFESLYLPFQLRVEARGGSRGCHLPFADGGPRSRSASRRRRRGACPCSRGIRSRGRAESAPVPGARPRRPGQ